MASSTTNLDLILPVGGENVSRQIINANNVKIDEAVGPVPSGTDLQSQVTALNSNTRNIVGNGTSLLTYADYDLNNLKKTGRYYIGASCTNKPGNRGGYIDVYVYDDNGTHVRQVFRTVNSETVFERACVQSVWGDWVELMLNKMKDVLFNNVTISTAGGYMKIANYTDIGITRDRIVSIYDTARSFNGVVSFHVNADGLYIYCSNTVSNGNITLRFTYT